MGRYKDVTLPLAKSSEGDEPTNCCLSDEQFRGQEWLPIESRALQVFLATAPSVGRGRWRPSLRVARDWQLAL